MRIDGKNLRSIWHEEAQDKVCIIDQTRLPHDFVILELKTLDDAVRAIKVMEVRGAPLIGATAAWGVYLALKEGIALEDAQKRLARTRPTAVNLFWALASMKDALATSQNPLATAKQTAQKICDDDVACNHAIGKHGFELFKKLKKKDAPLNILTHCNAGALATVDGGTALAPIYHAHAHTMPIHVWVDETRPRNQGAALTAWELQKAGIPHHVISDNAGGLLMTQGKVDAVITGTDRTAANGDVCNKIGTYLKALAAKEHNIPFFVALPSTSFDHNTKSGAQIPIEERSQDEVTHIQGHRITPEQSPAYNPAFDVTPAHFITKLITEKGACDANHDAIITLLHSA